MQTEPTVKLYYEDSHLCICHARVLECSPASGGYAVVLDQTVFFPEGGGQPCDLGKIGEINVVDVQEKHGVVYHKTTEALESGTEVLCEIDWKRRFSLMQNHSGEHIVSGLIHNHYGYDNVGFHMGSDRITLDINGVISKEDLRRIECEANNAVWKNVPIRAYFPDAEELQRLEYRSKLDLTENVRIVEIPGVDRCACCAPHVKNTGEIGMIRLLGMQAYKGGVRISMLCGERALEQAFMVQEQIEQLGVLFSVQQENVQNAVEKLLKKQEELNAEKIRLTQELLKKLAEDVPVPQRLLWMSVEYEGEDLRFLANLLAERNQGVTALFGKNGRYILISHTQDVRPLGQKLREQFHARGGGSERMVQGTISAEWSAIESFLSQYTEED